MTPAEREGLKEQLRAMAAERGDGLDLDSAERWVIEGLRAPIPFFQHLAELIPGESILYFEGSAIRRDAAQLYQRHRAANAVCVARDSIFPVPEIFHVSMSREVIQDLISMLSEHPSEDCFQHVKAYCNEKLLFTFHDAFDGSYLLLSDCLSEDRIQAFAARLGAGYRREPNVNKRDPEQLRRFLWALENPHKLRMNWPWWKKALLFWKRGL